VLISREWLPDSWQRFPAEQQVQYQDTHSLHRVLGTLSQYPPLVFVGEIESLKRKLAEASYGKCFLLQGGDCAEAFNDCKEDIISNKVKILLQMASVLCYGLQKPVVCVARLAGQYSKPRSNEFETIDNLELPVFRGESVNGIEATLQSRLPDPLRLLRCYHSSALTLNYIRSLASGGFADFHHPEQWELEIFRESPHYKMYQELTDNMRRAVNFIISLGGTSSELRHMNFFTCN
jgi:3-deoxy-7-phosphoheptulonate synthase